MPNFLAVFHGNLLAGSAAPSERPTNNIMQQYFIINVEVDPCRQIDGVTSVNIPGKMIYWAPSAEDLLMVNELCSVHGSMIVRDTPDHSIPSIEIYPYYEACRK